MLLIIGNQPGSHIHNEIYRTAVTIVLDPRVILELVIHHPDNCTFAKQDLIHQVHHHLFYGARRPYQLIYRQVVEAV